MPVYTYKICDGRGKVSSGTLAADTPAQCRQVLRGRGMRVIECAAAQFVRKGPILGVKAGRRRQNHVAEFARQLSMLLGAGIPLVEALDVLITQRIGRLTPVLRDVRDRVAAGSSFGAALEAHGGWFDNVFCTAVRVGQAAGTMDRSLSELASHLHERQTTRARIYTALAYPTVLLVVGVGVVLFLMSCVIPQLLEILKASGRELPKATVVVKTFSDLLTGHWASLIVGAMICVAAGAACYRWPPGRKRCHRLQLRLPLAGTLLRKTIIAQFAQSLSMLLRSGVPFAEALGLLRGNTHQMVLREELAEMEGAIRRGSDIAPALAHSRIFPPLVAHIVNVGQKTGELPTMLVQLKEGYETEVRIAVGQFTAAVEPILIVVMSTAVGFVVFATMMPILEATRAIQ